MTQTEPRLRRGWLRPLGIFGIVLVLLLLTVRAGVNVWAGRRVSARLAALEAAHGSLDRGTLRVDTVPEADNRARAMRAAAALLVEHQQVQPSLTRFQAQRGATPVPDDLRAFVETNRAALRVAHEGRSRRQSNWEVDYSTMHYSPALLEIRRLSTALYLEGRLALVAGQPDEAAGALATGLALAASFRQEPSLVTQLIRCAVALQHFEGVERLLTEAEPSGASLEMLAAALAENRTPAPMQLGLLGELKSFNGELGLAAEGSWLRRPLFRLAQAQYLESLGRLLTLESGPRPRPAMTTEPPSKWSVLPGAVASGTAGLERAVQTGDEHHSALGMTEAAVALRRHRLATGTYPEALASLTPTYLGTVPSDPLAGKPPVYARAGAGFTLHSAAAGDDKRPHAAALAWTVLR